MISRRRLLATLPALVAFPRIAFTTAEAQSFVNPLKKNPPPLPPTFLYFGTDTAKGVAKGIYLSRFDPATGHVSEPTLAAASVRPAYLAPFGACLPAIAISTPPMKPATPRPTSPAT